MDSTKQGGSNHLGPHKGQPQRGSAVTNRIVPRGPGSAPQGADAGKQSITDANRQS